MAYEQIVRFFDAVGDGSGNNSIKQNGSVTPVVRRINVPDGADHLKIERIRIYGEDTATTDADGTFLNLNNVGPAALTNGLEVGIYDADDNLVLDLTAGLGQAKNNSDFISSGWTYTEFAFSAGDSAVYVEREWRTPLIVVSGNYLAVTIQDDLTAFTAAHATAVAVAS